MGDAELHRVLLEHVFGGKAVRLMAKPFLRMFESLQQTAVGLEQATTGIMHANEGLQAALKAAIEAQNEQEDLRETVHRLEVMVLDLSRRLPPTDARGS